MAQFCPTTYLINSYTSTATCWTILRFVTKQIEIKRPSSYTCINWRLRNTFQSKIDWWFFTVTTTWTGDFRIYIDGSYEIYILIKLKKK